MATSWLAKTLHLSSRDAFSSSRDGHGIASPLSRAQSVYVGHHRFQDWLSVWLPPRPSEIAAKHKSITQPF
ncbi:unnamed protein product [Alternaria burnsii]|nr:unnamed protein product [Alternaria burnsii]